MVEKAAEIVATAVQNSSVSSGNEASISSDKFFSPLVKSIALKEGITATELEGISGTGLAGRVTKKDVIAYIENKGNVSATVAPTVETVTTTTNQTVATPVMAGENKSFLANIKEPIVVPNPGDEIIEMDRMRKIIAEHMVMSSHVSPHVTSYVEADVTNIVNWRNKTKKEFEKREGENLTFTPIFMEAIVKAIKDFPMINVEWLQHFHLVI
jgi:2-oxoglutarate dehydrogenase E2 component (dihydrolipoamide succinyltransferase)